MFHHVPPRYCHHDLQRPSFSLHSITTISQKPFNIPSPHHPHPTYHNQANISLHSIPPQLSTFFFRTSQLTFLPTPQPATLCLPSFHLPSYLLVSFTSPFSLPSSFFSSSSSHLLLPLHLLFFLPSFLFCSFSILPFFFPFPSFLLSTPLPLHKHSEQAELHVHSNINKATFYEPLSAQLHNDNNYFIGRFLIFFIGRFLIFFIGRFLIFFIGRFLIFFIGQILIYFYRSNFLTIKKLIILK